MKKKYVYLFLTAVLFLYLLCRPGQASGAAAAGILLWFRSLLPVLLPFFILSGLLTALDGTASLTRLIYPVLRRCFGCSPEGCFCLVAGFLCGYPVGARTAGDLVRNRKISREEGQYLLSFCNNASPAFLTGYCLTDCLKLPKLVPLSLGLIYGVPLLYGMIVRKGRMFPILSAEKKTSGSQISFKIVDACIMDGLESILKLGGYVILFSMLAQLLKELPLPSPVLTCIGTGLLEITNGIADTAVCPGLSGNTAWSLAMAFATFGGLSGTAQTESMIQGSGLSTGAYLKAKAGTSLIVFLLCGLLCLYSASSGF